MVNYLMKSGTYAWRFLHEWTWIVLFNECGEGTEVSFCLGNVDMKWLEHGIGSWLRNRWALSHDDWEFG